MQGNITLVSANAVLMNNLAARTAIAAQDKILNIGGAGHKHNDRHYHRRSVLERTRLQWSSELSL